MTPFEFLNLRVLMSACLPQRTYKANSVFKSYLVTFQTYMGMYSLQIYVICTIEGGFLKTEAKMNVNEGKRSWCKNIVVRGVDIGNFQPLNPKSIEQLPLLPFHHS